MAKCNPTYCNRGVSVGATTHLFDLFDCLIHRQRKHLGGWLVRASNYCSVVILV